eukprot:Seg15361.1 transcript_id=Seg15361.1/GoldUCD/mRNA.D3Y31 product="putative protein YtfP" protein_id=Seg15361.1/GoldUCD/D3Y31
MYDLIVIGGGAAGFFGAITAAETSGLKVLILEKSAQLLQKVKISGGGRCNVTHDCFDPKALSKHYPRGEKSLIGPLHRWGAEDTVNWFGQRGVELKTESDGRMFPITDSSQTVIDCLIQSAQAAGVEIRTSTGVKEISKDGSEHFSLLTDQGESLTTRNVLIATGGTRLAAGAKLATMLDHTLEPAVPSLFTFKITDSRIADLSGLSVSHTEISITNSKLTSEGPLLITHWGVSGPGILRISAWGARELHALNYKFQLVVNWLPNQEIAGTFSELRNSAGKRQVHTRSPFPELPKRLWSRLATRAGIVESTTWSQLSKAQTSALTDQLTQCTFQVQGKSLNKDEFVTCGGVPLKEINLKTMESKIHQGLYFAGEVMNIDGITGGFNFQNAWTSGHLAGSNVI